MVFEEINLGLGFREFMTVLISAVSEIAQKLKINIKTASEHIRRLAIPGLVIKRNQGKNVRHKLSDRGVVILKFLRTLE